MERKRSDIGNDVYDRLRARKRDDESFADLLDRVVDETRADWREQFGTLDEREAEKLERAVEASREQTSAGLAERRRAAAESLSESDDTDEAVRQDSDTAGQESASQRSTDST